MGNTAKYSKIELDEERKVIVRFDNREAIEGNGIGLNGRWNQGNRDSFVKVCWVREETQYSS